MNLLLTSLFVQPFIYVITALCQVMLGHVPVLLDSDLAQQLQTSDQQHIP